MNINDLLKDYNVTIHDCLLKQICNNLNDFEIEDVSKLLKSGYESNDPNTIRMMTLLNGIFTHHAQTFMVTKQSFANMLKEDNSSKYSNINGTDYKRLISIMMSSGHFECLRQPSNNKSGVYKLVQADLVDKLHRLHSVEWFKIQEEKVVSYYDGGDEDKEPKKRMYEIAKERIGKGINHDR